MTFPTEPDQLRPVARACSALIAFAFVVGWWNAGLVNESGALELATVVALFIIAAILVTKLPNLAFGSEWHLPVLATLLALRELDFDKRFIEDGILKLRLYTGDASVTTKLIGAAVIGVVLVCLYRLVRHDGPTYLAALRARAGWAVLIAVAVPAVVIAKSIDGLARKLAPLGIEVDAAYGPFIVFMEELLELGFAVGLLLSLFLWIRRHR